MNLEWNSKGADLVHRTPPFLVVVDKNKKIKTKIKKIEPFSYDCERQ